MLRDGSLVNSRCWQAFAAEQKTLQSCLYTSGGLRLQGSLWIRFN